MINFITSAQYGGSRWGKYYKGNSSEFALKIALDRNSNVFTFGRYSDTLDFTPNSNPTIFTGSQIRNHFLSKTNDQGEFKWATRIEGYLDSYSIATTSNGSVYVAGTYSDSVNFTIDTITHRFKSKARKNIFIAKYSSNGKLLFAKHTGTPIGTNSLHSICVDSSDNLIITGQFTSGLDIDFDTSTYILSIPFAASTPFIATYDSSFKLVMAKPISIYSVTPYIITVDKRNNLVLCGTFQSKAEFNVNGTDTTLIAKDLSDIFMLKIKRNGKITNIQQLNGSKWNYCLDLLVGNKNELYLHAYSTDEIGYLHKLDSNLNLKFTKIWKKNTSLSSRSATIDDKDNIYLSGDFRGSLDCDPSPKVYEIKSNGFQQAGYLIKVNSKGELIWAKTVGAIKHSSAFDISIDEFYNIYMCGTFQDSTNYGLDSTSSAWFIYKSTNIEPYILSYQQCYKDSFYSVVTCDSFISPSKKYTFTKTGKYIDTIRFDCGGTICHIDFYGPIDTTGKLTISTCYAYRSPSGKYTWTTSGTYMDTLTKASYCGKDSIIEISLYIHPNPVNSHYLFSCNPLRSPSGNQVWKTSGVYFDTLVNPVSQCDSILTYHLTIGQSDTSINIISCNDYQLPGGSKRWNSSGVYIDTLISSTGCDSIIEVNLTIASNSIKFLNVSGCDVFTTSTGKTYSTEGHHKDTLVNNIGCDSIITYVVALDKYPRVNKTIESCFPIWSPNGEEFWKISGEYYDTIASLGPCDTIHIFNVEIIEIDTAVYVSSDTLTAAANNSNYQWLRCNPENFERLDGDTFQQFVAKRKGMYAVEISAKYCIDTSQCNLIENAGVPYFVLHNNISIQPNPTNNFLKILSNLDVNLPVKYRLSNQIGQIVKFGTIELPSQINLESLKNGMYFLILEMDGEQTYVQRVMKM
mgnify:CR=1 FL=1